VHKNYYCSINTNVFTPPAIRQSKADYLPQMKMLAWFFMIMVALCNRADHYIFPCDFYLLSFFFPRPQIGCLPYFYTWRGPSANLECMSEMCCSRIAANTGCKKVAKNRHLGTIPQLRWATSSQLRHVSTIGKKLKQQYLLHMSLQYGELGPSSG